MKTKNAVNRIFRWLPTLAGLLFIGVVNMNHYFFKSTEGNFTAGDAISLEIGTLLFCGLVLLAQPFLGIYRIIKKDWISLIEGIASSISFFPLFHLGIECGAAIMYAT
ncbi:MAG: hypothetical protein ACSHYA_16985 [Opitutaceae bacterium]